MPQKPAKELILGKKPVVQEVEFIRKQSRRGTRYVPREITPQDSSSRSTSLSRSSSYSPTKRARVLDTPDEPYLADNDMDISMSGFFLEDEPTVSTTTGKV